MKRIISILIVAIILCSAVGIPSSAARSVGVKEEVLNSDKWLTLSKNTKGPRYFVDSKGKPVNLFGTARCQFHKYDQEWGIYGEPGIDSLIEHYADFGMNFIRLSLNVPEICGGKKLTDEEINTYITEKIDPDVQGIIRNGMYVMIDIHMYPQQETKYSVKTASEIVDYAREYYLPLLKGIARVYKDEPMVAVYEIWNEPYPADQQDLNHNVSEWNSLLRSYFIDAVNAIRKIDTRHVIMVSDFNAGWGMCTGTTWNGYYKLLDPVYRNTCFSTHIAREHVTSQWSSYYSWYKSFTRDNNICMVFGEIETEGDLMNTQGMKTLLNFFDETKNEYHFSGNLWRPHGWEHEYHELWAQNGWADSYCNVGPFPKSRYTIEAEDVTGKKSNLVETTTSPVMFGDNTKSMGISLNAGLAADKFYETTQPATQKIVYKQGTYKLMVRTIGNKNHQGDFIVGYKDTDGVVHQIARFNGKNSTDEAYHQTVSFTADKPIASFVFFGCETKEKSVIIDRLVIEGKESNEETINRSKYDVPNVAKKIIELDGKIEEVDDTESVKDESSKPSLGKGDKSDDSSSDKDDDNNNKDKNNNTVKEDFNGYKTDKNQSIKGNKSDDSSSDKENNNNTQKEDFDEDKTDKDQSARGKKVIKNSNTVTKEGVMLYVWIGVGIFGAVTIFVVFYIVSVKMINKNAKENTDEKKSYETDN